jgi:hypothetical protein
MPQKDSQKLLKGRSEVGRQASAHCHSIPSPYAIIFPVIPLHILHLVV